MTQVWRKISIVILTISVLGCLFYLPTNKTMALAYSDETPALYAFTRDLYFGLSKNSDVGRLQDFLRDKGFLNIAASTGNFLSMTRAALAKFQLANNIYPAVGYFGPKTRTVVNQLLTSNTQAPSTSSLLRQDYGGQAGQASSPIESSLKGKIMIDYFSGNSPDPIYEQFVLINKSKAESINITGFTIENSNHETLFIPRGYERPGVLNQTEGPIILKPGDEATIAMGRQDKNMNFRLNKCTGYFTQTSRFYPSIYGSCPKPDIPQNTTLSDKCLDFLAYSVSACEAPDTSRLYDDACIGHILQHYNYAGCFKNFNSMPDFYSNKWYIWMQRSQEFFKNRSDTLILKDAKGLIIDQKNYKPYF